MCEKLAYGRHALNDETVRASLLLRMGASGAREAQLPYA
jgi:hypothetical protein